MAAICPPYLQPVTTCSNLQIQKIQSYNNIAGYSVVVATAKSKFYEKTSLISSQTTCQVGPGWFGKSQVTLGGHAHQLKAVSDPTHLLPIVRSAQTFIPLASQIPQQ
jgi:hypothetical protein